MHKNMRFFIPSLILSLSIFANSVFAEAISTEIKPSPYPSIKWYVDQNHILFQDHIRQIPQKTYLTVNVRVSCESDHPVLFIDGLTHTSTKLDPCSVFNYSTPACNNLKGCVDRVMFIIENCRMGNCQASGTLTYNIVPYNN